jgi:hypothetical protein
MAQLWLLERPDGGLASIAVKEAREGFPFGFQARKEFL